MRGPCDSRIRRPREFCEDTALSTRARIAVGAAGM
jgi:hypothetical protein